MQALTPLVIKLGGGEGLNLERCCADIAALQTSRPLVIVHGVSAMMAELSAVRNIPVQMLTSPSGHSFRYTNPQVRDLYIEACHRANEQIVSLLRAQGLQAAGQLSPIVVHGQRKNAIRALVNGRVRIVRDDYSGSIKGVNVAPLNHHLAAGVIPVVPPLATSDDGLLNVDGDRAGAAVAGALRAGDYIILSNVQGLYRNFDDPTTHISTVTA
ncbi:MAG: [LysW]-aminoadipate kinase, partial [Chloroflexi bacterium]